MKNHTIISVAKHFSEFPSGRFSHDSNYSGETFREIVLVPALQEFSYVTIDLDSTFGFASNWLEEAFGGLVLKNDYTSAELVHRLIFLSKEDPSLIKEILEYISSVEKFKMAKDSLRFGPRNKDEEVIFAEEAFKVDVQCLVISLLKQKGMTDDDLKKLVGPCMVQELFSSDCNLTVKELAKIFHVLGKKVRVKIGD